MPWLPDSCFPGSRSTFQPRILLFHHPLLQLSEQRRRLAQCLAGRRLALGPRADGPGVIVGQRLVAPRFFLILHHLLGPEQLPVIPQVLVELLCRMRQDGRQERLQVVDDAQDDVDGGGSGLAVFFDLEPGRLAVQG